MANYRENEGGSGGEKQWVICFKSARKMEERNLRQLVESQSTREIHQQIGWGKGKKKELKGRANTEKGHPTRRRKKEEGKEPLLIYSRLELKNHGVTICPEKGAGGKLRG